MFKVYACLIGEWVCLSDDPDCRISEWKKTPYCWWKENAPIYYPLEKNRSEDIENTMYGVPYLHVFYKGKDYRINPVFIQIVQE